MQYVKYGKTDMMVSKMALGCMPMGAPSKKQGFDPTQEASFHTAVAAIHTALDSGINVLDTADSYGDGLSEKMVGEVMKTRRSECLLWTKCDPEQTREGIIRSCEESLRRLNTDYIDLYQLHGGSKGFSKEEQDYILNGGPLDALLELKRRGLVRYIGVTAEEYKDLIACVESDQFDSVQIAYNIIRQGAGVSFFRLCEEHGVGVSVMRPNTSGIFQRQLATLMPELNENGKSSELCIKFVLSDSRVHTSLLGMRSPERVRQNIALYNSFTVERDMADVPILTSKVYMEQDKEAGFAAKAEDYVVKVTQFQRQ